MKPLFQDLELVQLLENCKTVIEITDVSKALKYLHEEHNANISLHSFHLLALMRVRQLLKIKK